jgi:hypothetical protein
VRSLRKPIAGSVTASHTRDPRIIEPDEGQVDAERVGVEFREVDVDRDADQGKREAGSGVGERGHAEERHCGETPESVGGMAARRRPSG